MPAREPDSPDRHRERDWINRSIPFITALVVHAFLAGGLRAAGELVDHRRPEPPVEVEIVQPKPRPKPKPRPQPEVKRDEAVKKEVVKKRPPVRKRVVRRVATRTEPKVEPQPEPPAPGPNTNDDTPAPVYTLPDPGTTGGVPVARGKRQTRVGGTGGTGTNTGGGGQKDGTGPPQPVSIASIKTMPKPMGEPVYDPKDYPPGARRLGVEGQVKVRLVIDENGRVVRRQLVQRLGHGLDQWALRLASKLRFQPAVDTTGKKVSAAVVYTFTFVIPR